MGTNSNMGFPSAAGDALPRESAALLRDLHRFTGRRLAAARDSGEELRKALDRDDTTAAEIALHGFLRDCWEALDGLSREVNLALHHLYPEAALYPPFEMTRQCTLYMVRKKLHEHPSTANHPVSGLLWQRTRETPDEAYERLSFLYNLSLFFPLELTEGRLPGTEDLPPAARSIIKSADIARRDAREGVREMLNWVEDLLEKCYALLAEALRGGNPTR